MKYTCVFVIFALALAAASASEDTLENAGVRVALKLYEDCSRSDGFAPCLKKKALTFLDRLGRMQKLSLADGVTVTRVQNDTLEPPISEEQLEKSLPRGVDAQDQVLNSMLLEKVSRVLSTRSIQVTLPKLTDLATEEGRGKKMKGMLGGMMMGIVAKMAALIPVAIAGLFLLAGKALITAKIALLLSGIIALKKLVAAKQGGGGGHGHSSGHSSGWQSSGGGWDKRSIDEINESQKFAYNAYAPK